MTGQTIALGALLLAAEWASGQRDLIQPVQFAVTAQPYTASVDNDWQGNSEIVAGHNTYRVLRDSAGRQRVERVTQGKSRVTLYDVVSGQRIELDDQLHVARVHIGDQRLNESKREAAARQHSCDALPGFRAIGTKQIAGLAACGQMQEGYEVWRSIRYWISLELFQQNSSLGPLREKVVAFTAGEPDPALFLIPAGYTTKVVESKPAGDGSYKIGDDVSPPIVISAPEPEFSEEARRQKFSGTVIVSLQVGEDGLPKNVKVVRGIGHGLDEKAAEAVSNYKFTPAMRLGVPVKVDLVVQVSFRIYDRR